MNHDLLPSCDSEANGPLSISSLKQVVLPAMSSPIPFFSLFWLFLFSVFFYSCGIDLCTQDHFYQHRNILFCCLPQKEKKKIEGKRTVPFHLFLGNPNSLSLRLWSLGSRVVLTLARSWNHSSQGTRDFYAVKASEHCRHSSRALRVTQQVGLQYTLFPGSSFESSSLILLWLYSSFSFADSSSLSASKYRVLLGLVLSSFCLCSLSLDYLL